MHNRGPHKTLYIVNFGWVKTIYIFFYPQHYYKKQLGQWTYYYYLCFSWFIYIIVALLKCIGHIWEVTLSDCPSHEGALLPSAVVAL